MHPQCNETQYKRKSLFLPNEEASEQLAADLAPMIPPSFLISFSGEIGSGKTTFIRALLKCLGVQTAIKSPTFSLVESYSCLRLEIHHFDLYRIQHADELEYIGFRDYFSKPSLCCIEWPEHAGNLLPKEDIRFSLSIQGTGRQMHMQAWSPAGIDILENLAGELL